MKNTHLLSPEIFFTISGSGLEKLFAGKKWVWQGIEDLNHFLKSVLSFTQSFQFPQGVYVVNPEQVFIGDETVVEPGAYIEGPCYIGKRCRIRHGAYIRGGAWIGDGCTVGHDTEIKHSILFPGASAPHFNYVGDSILGNKANLGAGVKCANLRLDRKTIKVTVEEQRSDTGLIKLGAIIGDNAQIGCNTVTNPGTFLGRGVICHPCLSISGYVPANATIKSTNSILIEE